MCEVGIAVGTASVIASFVMCIIAWYYHRKTLELEKKDRERPKVIELLRFCIIPLQEWLGYQRGKAEPKELNLEKLLKQASVKKGKYKVTTIPSHPQPPHPKLLCLEFNSLLEKLQNKSDWDKKLGKYNEFSRKLSKNMNNLKQRLRELVDKDPTLKGRYEKTEAKSSYSFDAFKEGLVTLFFGCYERDHLSGAWNYAGKQIFNRFKNNLNSLIEKINELRNGKNTGMDSLNTVIDSLINLLEDVRKRLTEKYNLTSSEQKPLIELYGFEGRNF